MPAMLKGRRLQAATVCWLACLLTPVAIHVLTMAFGATEWRDDSEPIPWPAHLIDGLFWADVVWTVLLICLMRDFRWVALLIGFPLLCVTAVMAFWGGLWVSGQWL
jgi:hypothetical protein